VWLQLKITAQESTSPFCHSKNFFKSTDQATNFMNMILMKQSRLC
jgi:hypothetical protein